MVLHGALPRGHGSFQLIGETSIRRSTRAMEERHFQLAGHPESGLAGGISCGDSPELWLRSRIEVRGQPCSFLAGLSFSLILTTVVGCLTLLSTGDELSAPTVSHFCSTILALHPNRGAWFRSVSRRLLIPSGPIQFSPRNTFQPLKVKSNKSPPLASVSSSGRKSGTFVWCLPILASDHIIEACLGPNTSLIATGHKHGNIRVRSRG